MGENCFVEVQYSNWFLSLIATEASSCLGSWIQSILATLRIVLPLDQNYSSIRVESNFVGAGFKNSFSVGTKVVFFGVLIKISFVDAFSGIRNATD